MLRTGVLICRKHEETVQHRGRAQVHPWSLDLLITNDKLGHVPRPQKFIAQWFKSYYRHAFVCSRLALPAYMYMCIYVHVFRCANKIKKKTPTLQKNSVQMCTFIFFICGRGSNAPICNTGTRKFLFLLQHFLLIQPPSTSKREQGQGQAYSQAHSQAKSSTQSSQAKQARTRTDKCRQGTVKQAPSNQNQARQQR